ncbi:hypothetical protein QAD02_024099 [Eretmocerus hayati]|uniref:Uncharacterized protein n=1 Tax=Eretmocerus hayati TaxID=131215 RepID=A0ACC2PYH0_9HYME|nr:hypothetical protein QAD02_024099 [Eretmocerus hayati]
MGVIPRLPPMLLLIVVALLHSAQARPEQLVGTEIQIDRHAEELARVAREIQNPDVGQLRVSLATQEQLQPIQLTNPTGLSEAGDEWQRKIRSPDVDDDYEEVEEDGPEGRHLHGIKRKIKRKLKHKLHHGLGAPGLLGGGWQQPGYGPIAIANPGYGNQGFGGGWRPPHQHYHHHQFGGHGGGFGGGYGNPGWNPGFGSGGWRPGGAGPGASAQSWSFGPFQAAFAQSG